MSDPCCIGGPLDGSAAEFDNDHVCVPLPGNRYAMYHRKPWDGCMFEVDGNFHFERVVTEDELEIVE